MSKFPWAGCSAYNPWPLLDVINRIYFLIYVVGTINLPN